MAVDLHNHSQFSVDGDDDPAEMVRRAGEAGLTAVSVTDHNALGGQGAAESTAREVGIRYIPGVEMDLRWGGRRIHFLAYWMDPHDPALGMRLERSHTLYARGAAFALEALEAEVDPIEFGDWLSRRFAASPRPSQWRVAEYLLDLGRQPDLDAAYAFINRAVDGRPVGRFPDLEEVEPLVREAGGLILVAHPRPLDATKEAEIRELVAADLVDGFEVYHYRNDGGIPALRALAEELGCAMSGGSDCHGLHGAKNRIDTSPTTPDDVLPTLEAAYRRRFGCAPPS